MTTDVFKFMSLRSPNSVDEKKYFTKYFRDDYWKFDITTGKITKKERMISNQPIKDADTQSGVGKLILEIIADPDNFLRSPQDINDGIIHRLLEQKYGQNRYGLFDINVTDCPSLRFPPDTSPAEFYRIPITLADNNIPFSDKLMKAYDIIIDPHTLKKADKAELTDKLQALFEVDFLGQFVFNTGETENFRKYVTYHEPIILDNLYNNDFFRIKTALFETLYALYILRRKTSLNLEYIINGLRVLNIVELLAIDQYMDEKTRGKISTDDLLSILEFISGYSDFKINPINMEDDFKNLVHALPITNPVYSQLGWYGRPFNDIKPIGIGDLKVVRQTLLGYRPGEISYIHNVMESESYEKSHRRLDKTEDTFSFSSEQASNNERETQTTDKFEIKREADNVLKTDLQLNANASSSFNYNNGAIIANISAGMSYNNSSENSQKLSSNFARDIIDKAVTKVQNKVSQQRSSTKISEIEETNKHSFKNNKESSTHISGIYRWVDKEYESKVCNYGKRLMFEFMIPEPAAFYIMSKLLAYEMFDLEMPAKPVKPFTDNQASYPFLPFTASNISKVNFENSIANKFDLSGISPTGFPSINIVSKILDNDMVAHNNVKGSTTSAQSNTQTFNFTLPSEYQDYKINKVTILRESNVVYDIDKGRNSGKLKINSTELPTGEELGGRMLADRSRYIGGYHILTDLSYPDLDIDILPNAMVVVDLVMENWMSYDIKISIDLEPKNSVLTEWQKKVFAKVKEQVEGPVKQKNDELQARYEVKLREYNDQLASLKTQTVNDLIQGKSESYNKDIIAKELKKHCLMMLTKEFDSDDQDDLLGRMDAITNKKVADVSYEKFSLEKNKAQAIGSSSSAAIAVSVSDDSSGNTPTRPATTVDSTAPILVADSTIPIHSNGGTLLVINASSPAEAGFVECRINTDYPKINIPTAKEKGRYIQFLEQAFEWEHLAYIFYPYFWAAENKWIAKMNLQDYTDKNMTDFLQAGSVRILLAVQPSYNEAVMHYLATREPWEGGTVPVIGDPLYVPIFEEIHRQQDDLEGATIEGKSWKFRVPTSLVYLQDSHNKLPGDNDFSL